jgi:3-hydroxyisobutyrate dehydrogenase
VPCWAERYVPEHQAPPGAPSTRRPEHQAPRASGASVNAGWRGLAGYAVFATAPSWRTGPLAAPAKVTPVAEDAITTVGWVGTGVMGAPMCGHLIDAGYDVRVTNRTKERAHSLVERGAKWCATPREVAAQADVVVTIVGYPPDVREVTLGAEGALGALRPGSLVVDMTTSEPQLAKEIFEAAAAKGVGSLDAPVSGGDVGARNATLVVMAGGREEDFERALPVFQCLGKTVTLEGGPGAGQHTKMANQIAIASGMVGVCEALLYASRAGLDVARVIDTIGPGAAGSWSLSNYGPRALRGDFEPGFKVDHFIKDLGIALAEARRMRVALPGLALAEQLYVATSARGLGEKGTHSLLLALAELAGAPWGASGARGPDQVPGK